MAASSDARRPSRTSSRSSRSAAPRVSDDWSRLNVLKEEVVVLKGQLQQHESRRGDIAKELQKAREVEGEERRRLQESRITEQEKRLKIRARFQSAVRTVIREQRAMAAIATPTPDLASLAEQLEDQLQTLSHKIHGLKYGPADRELGATKLQSWWRCLLAKRVARCLRINCTMWRIIQTMLDATVKIQSWYRGQKIRQKWMWALENALRQRRKSDEVRLQNQIRVARILQKAIRVYLAKRRLARHLEAGPQLARESTDDSNGKLLRYVDNWRPAGEKRQLREGPPPEDRELAKMVEAGLIPFYSNVATNTIRHRIGGPHALKIQYQLGVGVGMHLNRHFEDEPSETSPRASASPRPVAEGSLKDLQPMSIADSPADAGREERKEALPQTAAEAPSANDEAPKESPKATPAVEEKPGSKLVRPFMFKTAEELLRNDLGGNWDLYPEGLASDLAKKSALQPVGEELQKCASKTRPPRRRLACTKPLEASPMRTEKRAAAREAAKVEADQLTAKVNAIAAVAHLQHPMLEGLLPLPNVPMYPAHPSNPKPPSGPPPGRARPGLIVYKEDCSWGDATSFYHEGSRRSAGGRSGWRMM